MFSRVGVMLLLSLTVRAQCSDPSTNTAAVKEYGRVCAPRVVLTHVRIIDGTGAAAIDDQNIVIEGGKITAVEKGADVAADKGTAVLDLRGHTGNTRHCRHARSPVLYRAAESRQPASL